MLISYPLVLSFYPHFVQGNIFQYTVFQVNQEHKFQPRILLASNVVSIQLYLIKLCHKILKFSNTNFSSKMVHKHAIYAMSSNFNDMYFSSKIFFKAFSKNDGVVQLNFRKLLVDFTQTCF